jgi:hypothetical protein
MHGILRIRSECHLCLGDRETVVMHITQKQERSPTNYIEAFCIIA